MGMMSTFLWLCLGLFLQGGSCLSEFHGILTEDELHSYSKKAPITEYDIILPMLHGPAQMSKRSVDSPNHNEAHKVTFTAFEDEHHVLLEKNRWLLRTGLEVEYLLPDGTIRKEPVQSRDCHFFATSISHNGSTGALSTCNGLKGVLSLNNEMLYIEPLKEDHTRRMKRKSEDATRPHIIYKRSVSSEESAPCPVGQLTAGNTLGSTGVQLPANEFVYTGPYLGAKYLEIFYVVDSLVYDEYTTETETYVTTVLNIMSRRYADPTLDISMRMSVVRLLISMTPDIRAISSSDGSQISVTPTVNGDTTLDEFCAWQAQQSADDDTNPNDWDLAILFTGQNLQQSNMDPSLLGKAFVGGTCDLNTKCSINENTGLNSALTMAHETGHNLGLQHDGVYGCTPQLNIMSASATSGSGTFEWSSCSSEHMKMFISTQVCMDDIPVNQSASITELPGQIYTANEQCIISMGDANAINCDSITTCEVLYCGFDGNPSCSGNGPPAEGTPCGNEMWCINAECVSTSLNISTPVNGGWTEYGNLSACSRTCGTGVQVMSRTCTNPTPQWGGMACVGESHIYMLCNEEPCATSQDDFRNEQCAATNDIPFNGVTYSWTDFQGDLLGDDLCQLNCLATEPNFYADREGVFCDGTRCWDDNPSDLKSTKMCLSGRCQTFGCDGVLNSGLVYDDCRVCDGDGSSCNCTAGTISTRTGLEAVYVTIPIGSTSITAGTTGNNQYVGLQVNGAFIFGVDVSLGNSLTSRGRYSIGNMIFDFDYSSNIFSNLRSLTEPSTETLDILVWAGSSGAINFTYRYCTPAPVTTPSSSTATLMSTSTFEMASTTASPVMATTQVDTSSDSPSSTSSPTSVYSSQSMTSMPATDPPIAPQLTLVIEIYCNRNGS